MPAAKPFPRLDSRRWRSWFALRRTAQGAFFLLFLFLLLRTEYRGSADIRYPVNAFFQMDPYLAAATFLSARTFSTIFWPAAVTLAATLLLGRVFCGWFCPLGSLLDFAGRRRGRPHPLSPPLGSRRHAKYYLLAATLAAAALGFQGAWLPDPFGLLSRAFSVSVIPAANLAVNSVFDFSYRHLKPLAAVTEPVYGLLERFILTFDQQHFLWGLASLGLLGAVLAMELVRPRFWCRYLCPLGAVISTLSRWSIMKRRVSEHCVDCGACYRRCSLGLISEADHRDASRECSVCLSCREVCPHGAITFGPYATPRDEATPSLSRRRLLGSAAAGILAIPFFRVTSASKVALPGLLRPPGSRPEKEFLERCVRCGSCMKVCMGNAIHPALMEAGPEGLMSPVMYFRLGYCEYNCTLCGQVCPTSAINRLALADKHAFKIGEAFIDQNRCLPYTSLTDCIVCEEYCPVPQKAIRFEEVPVTGPDGGQLVLKRPRVVKELCIGCGICETKCPLEGRAAIVVTVNGETRRQA